MNTTDGAATGDPQNTGATVADEGELELIGPAAVSWRRIANMRHSRAAHAATAAIAGMHGGSVVVMGGLTPGAPVADYGKTASRHTPGQAGGQAAAWAALPNMKKMRCWLAAATLNGTTVLALGGRPIPGHALASVEALDLAAGALHWTPFPSMTTPRVGHAAAVLHDVIYVAGGSNLYKTWASVEAFNGATWSASSNMTAKRIYFALVALEGPAGDLLVAAGGCEKGACTSAEAFDLRSWASIAPMLFKRTNCAGASVNGKAYVTGGNNADKESVTSVEVYDPVAKAWKGTTSMHTPRSSLAATSLVVGDTARIYATGGQGNDNNFAMATVEAGSCPILGPSPPPPPSPPNPGPAPPPSPPSPPPPPGHQCDPAAPGGCNVCTACCNPDIPDGIPCDTCFKFQC